MRCNIVNYEFCKKHADNGTSLYGDEDGKVYCYVGVSDEPAPECDISKVDRLVLTSVGEWPFLGYVLTTVFFCDNITDIRY